MCNQCEDVRRIHGNIPVWVLSIDGGSRMVFKSLAQAEQAKKILAESRPTAVFEIVETNNYYLKWE